MGWCQLERLTGLQNFALVELRNELLNLVLVTEDPRLDFPLDVEQVRFYQSLSIESISDDLEELSRPFNCDLEASVLAHSMLSKFLRGQKETIRLPRASNSPIPSSSDSGAQKFGKVCICIFQEKD